MHLRARRAERDLSGGVLRDAAGGGDDLRDDQPVSDVREADHQRGHQRGGLRRRLRLHGADGAAAQRGRGQVPPLPPEGVMRGLRASDVRGGSDWFGFKGTGL